MASPVTLAPKSSISKVAPDFPFGPHQDADIDLTLSDDVVQSASDIVVDPTIGSSADKPIELDLDLSMDFLTDNPHPSAGIVTALGSSELVPKQEEPVDLSFLLQDGDGDDTKPEDALLAAAQAIPPPSSDPAATHEVTQKGDPSAVMDRPSVDVLAALNESSSANPSGLTDGVMPHATASYDFENLDFLNDSSMMMHIDNVDVQRLFDISSRESAPAP